MLRPPPAISAPISNVMGMGMEMVMEMVLAPMYLYYFSCVDWFYMWKVL